MFFAIVQQIKILREGKGENIEENNLDFSFRALHICGGVFLDYFYFRRGNIPAQGGG